MTSQDEVDRTHEELQLTISSIATTKATLKNEHIQHRDEVEQLKQTIKHAKADILAIQSNTCPAAVEARKSIDEKRSAQMLDMEAKRSAIEAEIDELKLRIENDVKIHNCKMSSLQVEIVELRKKRADILNKNTAEMEKTELELRMLTEEYSKNKCILDQLEERLKDEKEEEKRLEQEKMTLLEEEANVKALEEKQHFAALWIQLRWKRFKKRQLLKPKKKSKGGKKKKKKS